MRLKLPLLRTRPVSPGRTSVLRYGVAVLSIILALIPAFLLSDVVESRLVVFGVAVMVSAWYGGWKPGLAATSFALTVSAYFALAGSHSGADFRKAIIQLALFVAVALLICWFNGALRSAQEGLRRSEASFRSLVTNAPFGICRCDDAGIIREANPALVSMLGYPSPDALTGINLANLHGDTQQWFTLADQLRSGKRFTGLVADWICQNGKTVNVRLSGSAYRGEGKSVYFELSTEDVTETRALEQQLRQAQKMEAIGRLAGGIAHDFNNILMVISGYCEFLVEGTAGDPQLQGPAKEIANAAERATSLTRQLLAFSRKQMLAPKVLDLNGIVTENLKMLQRVIGEDIDLVMTPASELHPVKADPGQIEQVIMNLAVNARDAMPKGGKLTIETANVSLDENYARFHAPLKPGEYVMLAISDTGQGMDSDTQTHIFEPFFTTKGAKGTGLGLSTVYGIIKQSEGYIWVSSERGKGTTFKIYLPRVTETGAPVPQEAAMDLPRVESAREVILLVEDESTLRGLVRQYLQNQGYTVLEAHSGAAALRAASYYTGPIHLLLTDIIMPGMNGRELAQQLSDSRPDTKVLYISGYTENVIGHNGTLEAGVNLLQKPFTLPALKTRVREVLDTSLPLEVSMAARTLGQPHFPKRAKISPFRAPRFDLHLPLKYRMVGESNWRDGTTENISRSGMLFQAEESLSPSAQLEINLVLPAEIAGLAAAEVVCRGEVVRTVEGESPTVNHALAAKIIQYHFQHGSRAAQA
jgi:PAS domain S-box-containing protein